jgi:glutaredoxin
MDDIIVYSQDSCPYCQELKELLDEAGIPYKVKNIDKYTKEWEKISKSSNNKYVPSVLIVNKKAKTGKVLAPDRDFDDVGECFQKIVQYITN